MPRFSSLIYRRIIILPADVRCAASRRRERCYSLRFVKLLKLLYARRFPNGESVLGARWKTGREVLCWELLEMCRFLLPFIMYHKNKKLAGRVRRAGCFDNGAWDRMKTLCGWMEARRPWVAIYRGIVKLVDMQVAVLFVNISTNSSRWSRRDRNWIRLGYNFYSVY